MSSNTRNYSDKEHPIYDVSQTQVLASQVSDQDLEELDLDSSAKEIRESVRRYVRNQVANCLDTMLENELNCWRVERAIPGYDENWCADDLTGKLLQDMESKIDGLADIFTQLLMKNKGKGWF